MGESVVGRKVDQKLHLLNFDLGEFERLLAREGEAAFHAKQVFYWVYRSLLTYFGLMTNVSQSLRQLLDQEFVISQARALKLVRSEDGLAQKVLLELSDRKAVESVLMFYPDDEQKAKRTSACLSSQIGCPMGCPFCATAQMGFKRNLDCGEIIEQVLFWARQLRLTGKKITNVAFMGMGEPLANYGAVLKSIQLLNAREAFGLGARHITISTCGLVPEIYRLADEGLQIGLAVSLHAARDELRDKLVPVNRKYPLGALMAAIKRYIAKTDRRVTFEYILLDGVNDSLADALGLADLLNGFLCHVNLIPFNPTRGRYRASPREAVAEFKRALHRRGVPVTIREERGVNIAAACGQLAGRR